MKKTVIAVLLIVVICVFAGCGCEHNWKNATCTAPQTCFNCGETQGVAKGHQFSEATFVAPKTCTVCGITEGSPLEKYVLSGAEYNRINSKLEGSWEGYIGSSLVEYVFQDGEFAAYASIGSSTAKNYGTYEITNGTIEFYYQNGTHKTAIYKMNGDVLSWDFPE